MKRLREFLRESDQSRVSPVAIGKKIGLLLDRTFPGKISIERSQANVTITFDTGNKDVSSRLEIAQRLAAKIIDALSNRIVLKTHSVKKDSSGKKLIVAMSSESFIDMPYLTVSRGNLSEAFSKDQLQKLKKEYDTLDKMDVTSKSYKSLISLLNSLSQSHLKSLADADIKFVSMLARNRLKKSESLDERCWKSSAKTVNEDSGEQDRHALIKKLQLPVGDGDLTDAQLKDFAKRSHAFVQFPNSPAHLSAKNDIESMGPNRLRQVIAHPKVNVFSKHRARQRLAAIKEETKKDKLDERCWSGYKPTPGKKPYEKGSCMKEDDDLQEDAEHDGKKVTLNKPFRTPGEAKKFAVYVKNDKGNVVKVTFGDPNMEIKRDDPERRANYRARHNCSDPGPKWKANYWSCKMWADKPVSKILESVSVSEEAPPDPEIEKWILANKSRFIKQYGEKRGLAALYATAWKRYNEE